MRRKMALTVILLLLAAVSLNGGSSAPCGLTAAHGERLLSQGTLFTIEKNTFRVGETYLTFQDPSRPPYRELRAFAVRLVNTPVSLAIQESSEDLNRPESNHFAIEGRLSVWEETIYMSLRPPLKYPNDPVLIGLVTQDKCITNTLNDFAEKRVRIVLRAQVGT